MNGTLLAALIAVWALMFSPAQAQDNAATAQQNAAPATPSVAPEPANPPPPADPAPVPQQRNAPEPADRFVFERVEDGVLRLDNETGHVALCGPRSVGWACQTVPEERAALEQEIVRIQEQYEVLDRDYIQARQQNEALEKQISEMRERIVALEKQRTEMRNEISALDRELTEARPPRPPVDVPPSVRKPGAAPPAEDKTGSIKMPNDEDIARAREYVRQAWRRLMDMIGNLQKDVLGKG